MSAAPIIVIVDQSAARAVHDACHDLAPALAERAGAAVTLAAIPPCCVDAIRPALTRAGEARAWDFLPASPPPSMSPAPFLWRDDDRPDWGAMWTSFCELALFGGPPHRGPDDPLRGPSGTAGPGSADADMIAEMRRGIRETTGLDAEPARPGWLAVTCDSPAMAAWLCATIILENVEARAEDNRLLVPSGPGYRLEDEVKSIVTVVAKTHHYWREHAGGSRRAS